MLTLIGTIYVGIYVLFLLFGKKFKMEFIRENSLLLAFIVSLAATLGSLFYSEILGYSPCKLCWFQRILIYPQALILGIALWIGDKKVFRYVVPMSVIGAVIAFYHYLLQRGIVGLNTPCEVVGYSSACSEQFMMNLGFITIPFMALVAFILVIVFSLMNNGSKGKSL